MNEQKSTVKQEPAAIYGWHFKFNNSVEDFTTDPAKALSIKSRLEENETCTEVYKQTKSQPAPEVSELVEALRDLHDVQTLPPLFTGQGEWGEAIHKAKAALAKWEGR